MTYLNLDTEAYVLFPVFALGSAATLGLVEPTFVPFMDMADVLIEAEGIDLTLGRILSLVALVAVFVNRDKPLEFDDWGTIEIWTVYVTVGLVLAPPIFPAVQDTLLEQPWAFVSFVVQGIGFGLVTYIN